MNITVSSYRRLGRLAFPQAGPTTQVRFAPTGYWSYMIPRVSLLEWEQSIIAEQVDLHRFNFIFRGQRAMQLVFGYGPITNTLVVQP